MQEMQGRTLGREDPLEKEGNGNPLQYFHLENPKDRGAWRAVVWGRKELDTTEGAEHARIPIPLWKKVQIP